MVLDFGKYMADRENERKAIEAQNQLAIAREALAESYTVKGVKEVLTQMNVTVTDDDISVFYDLMLQCIDAGLDPAQIDEMLMGAIADSINGRVGAELEDSDEEVENDD